MFEVLNHHECVVRLAVRGIANMPDNHDLATLKSVLFNQYLHLRLFRNAYEAMSTNPDPLQQDSHLRQLVLRLFDQERLDLLLEFSTQDGFVQGIQEMQDKVESIVRYRAQTMSVRSNVYYQFLLVFYLEQGNVRKAASVMYEQGLRLGLETSGDLESLQAQCNCYVACISLLRAGQPKYAWIVKPILENDTPSLSLEQRAEQPSEEAMSPELKSQVVDVLELKEIEREYELVKAHIQLIRCNPQRSRKGELVKRYKVGDAEKVDGSVQ
ncbi:hypothetical protein PR048_003270 [Dryococelus australis]|uniref:NUP160 middle TPR domain-containing protein n=1 Tax=Dryococelus australis TaxID=614101 RepID=A0ABQ9IML4_9NEOP|nr:hypothetical protein PR048_003270 [Dryococelus australis]